MKNQCLLLKEGNACPLESCNQFIALSRSLEQHSRQITQLRLAVKVKKLPPTRQIKWVDGSTITRFRQRYHFTQLEMSILLGVHVITVSRWENGRTGISSSVQKIMFELLKKSESTVRKTFSKRYEEYLDK